MTKQLVKHTAYENGIIRDSSGAIVAFYDNGNHTLQISGTLDTVNVNSMEEAMEIVGDYFA